MTAHWDPRLSPRRIDERDFYEIDDPRAQKEFLLRFAVLAPSSHNTQPWAFRIVDAGVEVYADYGRRLPVCDPADRELLMSVGASITNLRVAAAHYGFQSAVLYDRAGDPEVPVALVSLTESCAADDSLRRLFPFVVRRHTNRREFEKRELEPEVLDRLCAAVEEIETARFVSPHERARVAELVEEADRVLMEDEGWRKELSERVRPNEGGEGDGMPGDAFGIPGPLSSFASGLVRSFDFGESRGRLDRRLAEEAAGLIVISGDDDRVALLRAGEALERLLLVITSLGLQYALFNQVLEVPRLRRELWTLVRTPRAPQLLLRVGCAPPVKAGMPRRPLESATV